MSTQTVTGGWLDGHMIRRARKPHRCDGHEAGDLPGHRGPPCRRDIQPGEYYVEGECDPFKAGGYGQYRYCAYCATAGVEARAAINAASGAA